MNDFKNAKIADGLPADFIYKEAPMPYGFLKKPKDGRKGILSKEEVKEIRFRYDNAEKRNTQWFQKLAEEFEVSIYCVRQCAMRLTYRDE